MTATKLCRRIKLVTHDIWKMKHFAHLALTFSTVLHLGACQMLSIMPDEAQVRKSLGQGITLTCTATGEPKPHTLRWFDIYDNEITESIQTGILPSMPRVYAEKYNEEQLTLYITNIQTSDAGDYTCRGNAGGQPVQKKVTLTIYKDITFDDAPAQQHPVIHRDAIVRCRVSGNPTPTVAWRKNGKLLTPDDKYSMDEQGLHIKSIGEEDEGLYICRASVVSLGALKRRQITVTVYTPPTFKVKPLPTSTIKGEDAKILCRATGNPIPNYQWYKGNQVQPLSGDRYYVNDDGVLVIKSTSIDDGGQYRCQALNPAGTVDAEMTLTIIVKPTIASIDPYPQTKIGDDVTINCRATGSPIPTLKWRRDGTKIDYQDGVQPNDGRVTVIEDENDPAASRLNIKDAQIKDAGSYLCLAENTGGRAQGNATLTVEFAPVFDYPEIPFNYSWIDHAANLTCKAPGEPAPHIEWYTTTGSHPYLKWQQIENTENRYKIQGFLRRSNLEIVARYESDFREYRCNATNKHGEASTPLLLKRAHEPGPPTVDYHLFNPTWIEVKLTKPPETELPIIGYVGQVKLTGANWESGRIHEEYFEIGGNKYDDRYVLENLEPRRRYTFRFAARNDVGRGTWSTEREETLPEVRVPSAPTIVSSRRSNLPYGYRLRWKVPADGGKPIINYGVRWRKSSFENSKLVGTGRWYPEYAQGGKTERDDRYNIYFKLTPEGERTLYKIDKIDSASNYEVEIYARNEIGASAKSRIVFETGKSPGTGFEGKNGGWGIGPSAASVLLLLSTTVIFVNDIFFSR